MHEKRENSSIKEQNPVICCLHRWISHQMTRTFWIWTDEGNIPTNENKKTPSVSASDNMKSKAKSTKSNKGDLLMKVTILQNDMISMILNNPVSKHKANTDRNQEEMSNSTAIDEGSEICRSSRQKS